MNDGLSMPTCKRSEPPVPLTPGVVKELLVDSACEAAIMAFLVLFLGGLGEHRTSNIESHSS
jgi:hypothetical protein